MNAIDPDLKLKKYLPPFVKSDKFIGMTDHEVSIEYGIPEVLVVVII